MKPLLFTLCENDYHYGVAALVNSAVRHGFNGEICVFYRKEPPPWLSSLEAGEEEGSYRVGPARLWARRLDPPRHLGYHKPYAAVEAFRLHPGCDAMIYADPDIVFLSPWSFFENWISLGVACCGDSHFAVLCENHPWREEWRKLLADAGCEAFPNAPYANGGFFALTRRDTGFLDVWMAVTEACERSGYDTSRYYMTERHRAIIGDQDTLAAALMGWSGKCSVLGPEAMGFTGYHFILSHDINSPKAWRNPFVRRALEGYPPSRAAGLFLEYADAPIAPYATGELTWKKMTYRLAQLISRVWRR